MTVSVSAKNFTSINYCENASNFTGSTPSDVTDFFKQGTQCVGFTMKSSGNNDTYLSGSWNLSSKHLHFWYMTVALKELNVEASGGFQVYLSDGTNTGYYYMTGSDTYPGGFLNLVLDCNRTPDSGSQPTLSSITTIGFRQNLTTTAKNIQNTWIDNIYIADGLIAYGDVSGSPFDLDDIMAVEDSPTSGGWGMMRKIGGVYFLVGALELGDSAGTNSLDFEITSSEQIVFEDRPVATSYYNITVIGNSTGTTSATFGAKSGSQGVSGCSVAVESLSQTPKWYFDGDDSNVDVLQIYGCKFIDYDSVALPTYDSGTPANREVLSTNFESGNGAVTASTCPVEYCNFITSSDAGVEVSSTSHRVKNSNFIACTVGVRCTTVGTYTFDSLQFTGCTNDVENSANATTTDSYSETNYDSDQQLYAGGATGSAQSVTGDGNKLTSVSLYLRKVGSPTGNAVVKLYAHSGTFGSSSVPTGAALATSKNLDVSSLGTSYAVKKIDFDDSEFYTLVNATKYCIAIEYSGGDSSNRLEVGYDAGGSHGGNKATYTGSWSADASDDLCFYVRTNGDVTIGASGSSNPTTTTETGTPAGVTNINNTSTITFTKMKDNTEVRVYEAGTNIEVDGIEDATDGSQDNRTFSWTGDVGLSVDYVLHNFQPGVVVYKTIRVEGYTVPSSNATIEIQQTIDRNVS